MRKNLHGCLFMCLSGAALILVGGCTPPPATPEKKPADKTQHHDDHAPGPHKGIVVDWSKYHAEVCFDRKKKEVTVYVLGGDEKTPAPIKAEKVTLILSKPKLELDLKPMAQKGDPEGASSRFVGKHDEMGGSELFAGTISGVIDNKPYAADFKEEPGKK